MFQLHAIVLKSIQMIEITQLSQGNTKAVLFLNLAVILSQSRANFRVPLVM
jgi:hypothetical protein